MAGAERGRQPERAGEEYYTTSEAAKVLGVSRATIINYIKGGTLEGRDYFTEAQEHRWEAARESVEREALDRGRSVQVRDLERTVSREAEHTIEEIISIFRGIFGESNEHMIDIFVPQIEKVAAGIQSNRKAIEQQDSHVSGKLDALSKEVRERDEALNRLSEVLERLDERFARIEEAEFNRQEAGEKERRSFWRRLFNS